MKTKANIAAKQRATFVVKPNRNVPFAALEQVNKELGRLESLGTIEKMNNSDWAAPMVYMKKGNSNAFNRLLKFI